MPRPTLKSEHVLNAASNLLGVALLMVTFVHVTEHSSNSPADELAFSAALLLMASCILSQRAISTGLARLERWADATFLVAQLILLGAVVTFWF